MGSAKAVSNTIQMCISYPNRSKQHGTCHLLHVRKVPGMLTTAMPYTLSEFSLARYISQVNVLHSEASFKQVHMSVNYALHAEVSVMLAHSGLQSQQLAYCVSNAQGLGGSQASSLSCLLLHLAEQAGETQGLTGITHCPCRSMTLVPKFRSCSTSASDPTMLMQPFAKLTAMAPALGACSRRSSGSLKTLQLQSTMHASDCW